jgi:hypothetical protein
VRHTPSPFLYLLLRRGTDFPPEPLLAECQCRATSVPKRGPTHGTSMERQSRLLLEKSLDVWYDVDTSGIQNMNETGEDARIPLTSTRVSCFPEDDQR